LTGGGDVPGLNPCIKAAVYHITEEGHEVVGIRRGWGGLLFIDPANPATIKENVLLLDRSNTRTIDRSGGTFLHTSRTNPGRTTYAGAPEFLRGDTPPADESELLDFTPHILKVLGHLGLDALVTIGGDDTLSYS
jgi:ATP-dependent phosphofructokinase / diphosphate-dependent phosphofructokinase